MTTTALNEQNPTGGKPAGLQDTAAERVSSITSSKPKSQSYADVAAKAKADEYAWITDKHGQGLSDELDVLMKRESVWPGFSKWTNMYLMEGRKTACIELMYEKSIIEFAIQRRQEEEAREMAEAPRKEFEYRNHCYLHNERLWSVTSAAAFAHVQKTDAAFIAEQKATGFPTDDLERKIAERQKYESENLAWEARKRQIAEQAIKDQDRKMREADERLAAMIVDGNDATLRRLVRQVMLEVMSGK